MVKCDYCNEDIDYLPFTCRYCGKSYCKIHRIPENHECSFEFKNDPFKIKALERSKPSKIYSDYPAESYPKVVAEKRVRSRPPRIKNRSHPQVTSLLGMQSKPYGTYGLMIANAVFYIIAYVLAFNNLSDYIYLSISDYIGNISYWTFLTSMFIPNYPSILGFFWLLLELLMLFLVGRMIEARWGWKTLLKIYILSGLLTSAGILIIQWGSSLILPSIAETQFYSSWGAYMGLVSFIALLFPQQQVTMFLYFIPIRVKMKNLIWIFVGISALFGIINLIAIIAGINNGFSFPQHFGSIVGVLGGLIINRSFRQNS
ncbi:MAG: rhomboid family intramembrane serine protease [Candidatus Lokiarchaeota archaeon]|nr:rhomboid family intramembrane serine protease [Candidatus Lokiarchaeota archaeon]